MTATQANPHATAAMTAVVVVLGLAVGFALSILGLAWPWGGPGVAVAVAAAAGWALRRRTPHLLWLAVGIIGGAAAYLVLGLLAAYFGQPPSGSGGS